MTIKASDVRTNLILDRGLKAELEAWAKQDNRSFNNFVNTVLKDYAAKRRGESQKS